MTECKALEALKKVEWVFHDHTDWAWSECPCCEADKDAGHTEDCELAAAIRDHRDCDGYGALMETLGRLFAWEDDPRSIPIGMWKAAYDDFKAVENEPRCLGGPDCPHWQEGHEAQREPAGRGTA